MPNIKKTGFILVALIFNGVKLDKQLLKMILGYVSGNFKSIKIKIIFRCPLLAKIEDKIFNINI